MRKTADVMSGSNYRVVKEYLEDRRPGANMEPYLVCAIIA